VIERARCGGEPRLLSINTLLCFSCFCSKALLFFSHMRRLAAEILTDGGRESSARTARHRCSPAPHPPRASTTCADEVRTVKLGDRALLSAAARARPRLHDARLDARPCGHA
jgi:hypothetical protein